MENCFQKTYIKYKKTLDLLIESSADSNIITNHIKNCIEL